MFIAHLHAAWYEWHYKKPAPLPYAIAHLGHAHIIEPPIKGPTDPVFSGPETHPDVEASETEEDGD